MEIKESQANAQAELFRVAGELEAAKLAIRRLSVKSADLEFNLANKDLAIEQQTTDIENLRRLLANAEREIASHHDPAYGKSGSVPE